MTEANTEKLYSKTEKPKTVPCVVHLSEEDSKALQINAIQLAQNGKTLSKGALLLLAAKKGCPEMFVNPLTRTTG